MSYEIVMPRLGWNMEEGTLVEWLKADGEMVIQGETVCTIEGDKAATDIESFERGILKIPDASPQPGNTVPVGTLLGYIVSEKEVETFDPNADRADDAGGEGVAAGPGEGVAAGPGRGVAAGPGERRSDDAVGEGVTAGPGVGLATGPADEGVAAGPAEGAASDHGETTGSEPEGLPADVPIIGVSTESRREQDEPAISPRARRAAKSAGIDWRQLKGSGRSGRIVERDVLEAARKHRKRDSGKETKTKPILLKKGDDHVVTNTITDDRKPG